ncbi:hypothetical protein NFI96_033669 [Prochilodus magdalenae]|nr:hypothetical protein NFI96_033669 [Prochilodus magdalenae]
MVDFPFKEMLQSWDRRAAEGLSNAEYMRELRHRNDLQYQEQLRRREREREEAETRRQTQRMITPRLAPLRQSKFKTRSYDRPWAASTPDSVKTSPTSVKPGRPDAQHGAKRSSVERLPDLVSGTRSRPAELKASKTSQRAQKNSSVRCSVLTGRSCTGKERSSQHLQSTAVTPTIAPCKMSPKQTARTARRAQTRRRNVLESRLYVTETPVPQETPRHTDAQTTMDTQRLDYLPRQLTPPYQSPDNWTRFPSLGNYSPSPESEPTPELLNPFQSLPDISSISEDSLTTENSDSRATSTSSADSSVQWVWSSTTSELDSSSLSNGSSIMGPSSGHNLTSEEDEDEGHFTSWHDLRSLSGPSTTLQMSSPARTLRLLSTPTTLPPDSPSFTRYESTSRALQEARASPSNRRGTSTDPSDFRLPALEESPGRTSPELDEDEDGRMLITSLEAATSGPVALLEGWSVSGEAGQPRRTSLMDHLNLALVVLHDLCREVTQSNRDDVHTAGFSGNPESKRSSDPETLRRITERLLEEESDEEDEDTCRICQCKGTSPTNPLQSPCQCSGSLQYIHRDCLRRWIQTKIKSGAELSVVKTCELCKGSLTLDLDDFDIEEYYWQHRPTQLSQDARQLFMLLQLQRRFAELLHLTQTRSTTVSGNPARLDHDQQASGPHSFGVEGSPSSSQTTSQAVRPGGSNRGTELTSDPQGST